MNKTRSLLLNPWTDSRLSTAVRNTLYVLVAGIGGWQLGRAVASPSAETVASLILMGVSILIILKRPLEGLLLALALYPFSTFIYLNLNLGASVPDVSLMRAGVAITFALILARGATTWRPLVRPSGIELAMLLAAMGLGLSALRGASLTLNLQFVFDMYLTPYMVFFIAKNLTTDRSKLERVLWAIALIGAYSAIYGIYTQTTGHVLFVGETESSQAKLYTDSLRIMRGLLGSPHVFGLVFSLAIPVDFYLLIKARTSNKKVLWAAVLAVTFVGLFFTYKRTAWIATVGSLLVIQFFFPRFRRLFLALIIVVAGMLLLYSDEINDSAVVNERVNEKADTLNGRTDLWDAAWKAWEREPVVGYGIGQYQARSRFQLVESHYLAILVSAGLVGFIPFALVFGLIAYASIKIYRARTAALFVEPDLVAAFWGCCIAYLISLSTVVMNHELPHALFFLLAGAAVGSQEAILNSFKQTSSRAVSVGAAMQSGDTASIKPAPRKALRAKP
ncbi:MAG TPA: O-antigen ligase family protein [Anaerolineae bacterium]|nr:O-antigen ligase family protein [Anaerolineae bacterium]